MKTATLNRTRFLGLVLGGALLCLAAETRAQNDPSGTWDFVISGSRQQGVAFLTFAKEGTITGFEVTTSYTPPPSSDGRGDSGVGRTPGSTGSTNLFVFGLVDIAGSWNYDAKGRTIGFLNQDLESSSFVATVKPGRRLTMKVTDSPNPALLDFQPRNRVFKGIPIEPTDDVSGNFYADGLKSATNSSQKFIEFFSLANLAAAAEADSSFVTNFPFFTNILANPDTTGNAYFYAGSGPGYTNFGVALFSAQKKMAIASIQASAADTNGILRSVSGGFNVGSGINGAGRLLGVDEDSDRISYKVRRF